MSGELRRALLTGITGQDGRYLTELLLSKGYEVHGIVRRPGLYDTQAIAEGGTNGRRSEGVILHYGDLRDGMGLLRILDLVEPDEIYNLGAQSHVRFSFDQPEYTADVVANGTLRMLEAMRHHKQRGGRCTKYYQAGSSEMFGSSPPPQSETTPFHPRSPYAVSKCAAYWFGVNYREAHNLFVCNGILFNHESPLRPETFVTRKITMAAARIKLGLDKRLSLGNLDARRDWGFAGDYVEAMWLMMQQEVADDFVIATGESHTVKEFVEEAFSHVGLHWEDHVDFDRRHLRPTEVDRIVGDPGKAQRNLGWRAKVGFKELVRMMVDHDLALLRDAKGA